MKASGVRDNKPYLQILKTYLLKYYPPDHPITLYEAAQYPTFKPVIHVKPLQSLSQDQISVLTTMCIPPVDKAVPDKEMMEQLDIMLET